MSVWLPVGYSVSLIVSVTEEEIVKLSEGDAWVGVEVRISDGVGVLGEGLLLEDAPDWVSVMLGESV